MDCRVSADLFLEGVGIAQTKCHGAVAEQHRATVVVAKISAPNMVSRRNS